MRSRLGSTLREVESRCWRVSGTSWSQIFKPVGIIWSLLGYYTSCTDIFRSGCLLLVSQSKFLLLPSARILWELVQIREVDWSHGFKFELSLQPQLGRLFSARLGPECMNGKECSHMTLKRLADSVSVRWVDS